MDKLKKWKTSFMHDGNVHIAKTNEYMKSSSDTYYDLTLYQLKGATLTELYSNTNSLYSLRDASTLIRTHLLRKGMRIKWEEVINE